MKDTFSRRIKELRTSLYKTQSEFADFIGTTQSALSGYENEDRTPSYEILITISEKCNVSVDWLCGLSDKMTLANHITTYKEFFKLFITILNTHYQEYLSTSTLVFDEINIDKMSVSITLHEDPNFEKFFSKWYNIFKLYREGTIDDDLYEMWIEKQLKEYDKLIDGAPF